MNRFKKSALFISTMVVAFGIICRSNLAVAQIHFTASAPKTVAENQNFNLSFTLENANGNNLKLPSLNDFTLLGGPNTSTSMQFINGSMSQSMSSTYVLRPKHQGTFKIGKATMEVNGSVI